MLPVNTIREVFECPITTELLIDPVIDPCGHTFERADIEHWLEDHNSCPLNRNQPLVRQSLIPNRIVREALQVIQHHQIPLAIPRNELAAVEIPADDRAVVNQAMQQIFDKRTNDAKVNIPSKLSPSIPSCKKSSGCSTYPCFK